jgi:hypothetical protein
MKRGQKLSKNARKRQAAYLRWRNERDQAYDEVCNALADVQSDYCARSARRLLNAQAREEGLGRRPSL